MRPLLLPAAVALGVAALAVVLRVVQVSTSPSVAVGCGALLLALLLSLQWFNRRLLPGLAGGRRLVATVAIRGVVATALWWVLNPGTVPSDALLVGFGVAIGYAAIERSRTLSERTRADGRR